MTADLFAEPCPAAISSRVTREVPLLRPRLQSQLWPVPRARPRHLWHAVVFPELTGRTPAILPRLCACAQQFTSWVSVEEPNALLLEIHGSIKLFGSLAALLSALQAAWNRLALRAQSATAPTALAALWFARAGQAACIEKTDLLAGALAPLPIGCTAWDFAWLQTLRSLGVTRIGEVLRLPRSGVARRLDPAAVRDLDIALARQAAPRRAFVPRPRFVERCEMETEIETVDYLQRALEPVLERCARFLCMRQAGVQTLELRLRHRMAPMTRVHLGLAGITSERYRLAAVVHEKLQRLALRAPVSSLELRSGALQPLTGDSLDVFAAMRAGTRRGAACIRDAAPHLLERLRARLGEGAVHGVCSIAAHRPEAASRRVHEWPFTASSLSASPEGAIPAAMLPGVPRPVWLLAEPLLLAVTLESLQHRGVTLEQGPERIESGWWDGKDVTRDYYTARQAHGARWWVFRERHTAHWFLHGVFA